VIEVWVATDNFEGVLLGDRGDPKIVLRNRFSLLFELVADYGVPVGSFSVGTQYDGCRFKSPEERFQPLLTTRGYEPKLVLANDGER
jgi:hypothetical protein